MIILEDSFYEAEMQSGNMPIAVPFEIYGDESGKLTITVYPCFEEIARLFESIFGGREFSAAALEWLNAKLSANVKEFGYSHFPAEEDVLLEYEYVPFRQQEKSDEIDGCIIAETEADLAGLDCSLISDYVEIFPAAIAVFEGKIAAVSMINDLEADLDGCEIFVETLPGYRLKGYAKMTVSLLSKYLLGKGKKVYYKCAENNKASVAVAESAGFKLCGKRYSYICYAE